LRNQSDKKRICAENYVFLITVLKITFIYTESMEFKLLKNIKDIALQRKKRYWYMYKIALRQYLTSYFDGGIFDFKCRYKSYLCFYLRNSFLSNYKYTKFCKIWYITHKPYAHNFEDSAALLLRFLFLRAIGHTYVYI
jgi:hypothetical protein